MLCCMNSPATSITIVAEDIRDGVRALAKDDNIILNRGIIAIHYYVGETDLVIAVNKQSTGCTK